MRADKDKHSENGNSDSGTNSYFKDLSASLVVFFVALPLCMGIAIASGMHPASGIVTGIIGGIIVGVLSGSPLQVSGPAAGLAVIVWDIVNRFGVGAFALMLVVAGVLQIIFGMLKMGRIFRAVSPAVVQGMLSGIGLLILASQFHVMLDDKPKGSGLDNLIGIPKVLIGVLTQNHDLNHLAALLGLITIAIIIVWEKLPVDRIRDAVPATLLAVLVVTILATVLGLDVNLVQLPPNLLDAVTLPDLTTIPKLGWEIVEQGLIIALIASAETLLTANAIDRMAPANKCEYDKELAAQGIGNTLCGLLGALPLTGVIVRSSVNVRAGAQTRVATICHGIWLLLFTLCFSTLIKLIPTSALAALLVYTGFKLLDIKTIRQIAEHGRSEFLILIATMGTIVATDLLTGVITGIILSTLKLLYVFCRLHITKDELNGQTTLKFVGAATFFSLPKISAALERVPPDTDLRVDFSQLTYIDHACLDMLLNWGQQYQEQGGTLAIDWGGLQAKFLHGKMLSGNIIAVDEDQYTPSRR